MLLDRIALIFKQHHDHRDAQKHLRNRAEKISSETGLKLSRDHQHSPERQRKRERTKCNRASANGSAVEIERAVSKYRGQTDLESIRCNAWKEKAMLQRLL